MDSKDFGTLYICATPIGNIEDISLRALNILKEVDIIAAEDTRHTLKLLNHYNISKPLISYHEHNKRSRDEILTSKLMEGNNIALVSDAGMPGISDPGHDIIKRSIELNINVTVIPGPSASITALVLSGLPTDRFVFEGFLPRDKKDRDARLKELSKERRTMIFYEAPHRVKESLNAMSSVLGNRKVAVARELTKRFEEVLRDNIDNIVQRFQNNPPKGEFVIIVEGSTEKEIVQNYWDHMTIKEHINYHISRGKDKKESIKEVAIERNVPKREIYQYSLDME